MSQVVRCTLLSILLSAMYNTDQKLPYAFPTQLKLLIISERWLFRKVSSLMDGVTSSYDTHNQDLQELYVLGMITAKVYRFSLSADGSPQMLSTFTPQILATPYWGNWVFPDLFINQFLSTSLEGITMFQDNVLLGVSSSAFPGLLLINSTTGHIVASATDVSTFSTYSSLAYNNVTGFVYEIDSSLV